MPLLNKKKFTLEPVPKDLEPNEEVFLCQPTQEIFRDYEKFFNRMFQCNSQIWTCELTGTSGLTFSQALASENETKKMIDSLETCYQRAALQLVHHVKRTNIKALADEISAFYRDRFIKGEVVELSNTTSSGAIILHQIQVMKVILPTASTSPSPIKLSVITGSPQKNNSSPQPVKSSPVGEDPLRGLTNGSLSTPPSVGHKNGENPKVLSESNKKSKTPKLPLSPETGLNPALYKYVVQYVQDSETRQTVKASLLSRSKGVLTPKKLKLFLRNATFRVSEKHPFMVKDEYVTKFELGESSIDFLSLPTPTRASSRKRSFSQSKLDSFFSPGSTPSSFSLSDSFLSGSSGKKPRLMSLVSSKSERRKSTSNKKKSSGGKLISKTPTKVRKLPKSTLSSKSPMIFNNYTPSKSQTKAEVLKVLNKAKRFKQLDLKKSVFKKGDLNSTELKEMEVRRALLWEEDKRRRKEQRLGKLREQQERKRLERIRQREWLKPREDLLCEDSKSLPKSTAIITSIPPEFFGDAVMILEFLNAFGPLFDIKEIIRESITFDKIEYAISTQEMDSMLFEITKFLLQAIFATMVEEYENVMVSPKTHKNSQNSPVASTEGGGENRKEHSPINEAGVKECSPTNEAGVSREETPCSDRSGSKEAENNNDEVVPMDDLDEAVKSLDVRVETIKAAAVGHSQWTYVTQHLPLHEVVIDAYTVTEVLRLHFLSCGGYKYSGNRNWFRHSRRGGFNDTDDPSMSLRLLRSDICSKLALTPIYSLSPQDKLEVLSCLCSQLLTYSVAREFIDESKARAKKARRLIKEIQFSEERRKKEERKAKLKKQQEEEQKQVVAEKVVDGTGGGVKEEVVNTVTELDPEKPLSDKEESNSGPEPQTKSEESSKPCPAPPSGVSLQEIPMDQGGDGDDKARDHQLKIEKEILHHQEVLREASGLVNIQPIGYDRYHRRYMLFPSMHGLFVEDLGHSSFESDQQISSISQDTDNAPLIKTTPQKAGSPGDERPAPVVERGLNKPDPMWSHYDKVDDLLTLLNPRGIREGELRKNLESMRNFIELNSTKCIFKEERVVPDSQPKYSSATDFFELYLREQILDIEEKIHIGNLGYISDRTEWRDRLENSGAAANLSSSKQGEVLSPSPSPQISVPRDKGSHEAAVRELANAILQVQAGIGKKFLMPPLGTAVDQKKRKRLGGRKNEGAKMCLEQWRLSLSKTTSFSQIFLHLATLERAVMWSKSLMNVRCRICRRKCGDELLLLCDGCDHGYHTYCLKPPLKDIPEGDWFCNDCIPATPIKPRRRAPRVVIVEEEEEEEEEEVVQDSSESEEEGYLEERLEESEEEDIVVPVSRSLRSSRSCAQPSAATQQAGKRPRGGRRKGSRKGKRQGKKKVVTKKEKPPLVVKRGRGRPRSAHKVVGESSSTGAAKEGSRARKKLKLDSPAGTSSGGGGGGGNPPNSGAECVIASIIELQFSHGGRQQTGALRRELRSLEMQLCQSLWEELNHHQDSWCFALPVSKKEFPDYYDVISKPIDLCTVKRHIKCGHYDTIDDFLQDILLIFTNSLKYHKRVSEIGKAASNLKRYFEKRCNDLGLKDLHLSQLECGGKSMSSSNRTRKSGRLRH